ncbi:polyketide cyclase/dehydrase and lipid transportsuperfamily protein [Striga asiatica]|uniref:Polyketide cyclase/dehydrase and lipid transportsuperfamily protein n=1 Tax=Striga asiatica TaxID=4170 RepID=A0A5A7QL48_STRAF|nr:polyketide cyclase/dehydrase and lipid transportsuperfamily protein [Striga asiatica]
MSLTTTAVVTLVNSTTLSSEKPRFPSFASHLLTTKRASRFSRYKAHLKKICHHHHLSGIKFRLPISPVMQWQDCTVRKEVDVPVSVAYNCYSDREAIPQWMPFISSVKILEDRPDLSRWSLKYEAFGRDIEFSWLARNMQPIKNQKIHWRSMEGLPNRWQKFFTMGFILGAVRFFPKGGSACTVELTVSYEVPQLLVPVASALQPFLESLLARGLERFATFAKTYSAKSTM